MQTYVQIQNSRFDNNHCWNEIICHSGQSAAPDQSHGTLPDIEATLLLVASCKAVMGFLSIVLDVSANLDWHQPQSETAFKGQYMLLSTAGKHLAKDGPFRKHTFFKQLLTEALEVDGNGQ